MKFLQHWLFVFMTLLSMSACSSLDQLLGDVNGRSSDLTTESDESGRRKRARLRVELASGYFEQGQTAVALDEIKQSLNADSSYAPAYDLRGLIYMRLNENLLAQESFLRALELSPGNPSVAHNLGWLMCQTGRYPAAQDYFNQALENANYAGRSKTLLTKGICYHRSGDTANAEVYLVKAYELDVTNAVTGFNLAKVLYINKKYDLAASYIHRVNLLPQSNAETLWLEIQLAKKIGQSTLMQELMVQLKKRYPQSAQMGLLDKGVFDD